MAAPALPPALLVNTFGNKRNNQVRGEGIASSLANYLIDPTNVGDAVAPEYLLREMTQNTDYKKPSVVGIIVNGTIRPLCMPQKMELLIGQVEGWNDLIIAGDPFNVAITSQHLALSTATLTV